MLIPTRRNLSVKIPRFIGVQQVVSNFDGDVEVGVGGVSVRCFVFVRAAHAQCGDDPFWVISALDPGEDR